MSRFRLLPFMARCVALAVALSALWFWLGKGYTSALAACIRALLPEPLGMEASGHALKLLAEVAAGTSPAVLAEVETLGFGYGVVLTGAIVLSAPGLKLRSRLLGVGISWAVLFVAQVVVVLIFGRIAYATGVGEGNPRLVVATLWFMYGVWMVLPPLLSFPWVFHGWLKAGQESRRAPKRGRLGRSARRSS